MFIALFPRRAGRCMARMTGVLAALTLVAAARASSVIPMPLATLAEHAGQVIVGQVASVRAYWADSPRRIQTEVVFGHVEYLKGRLADSTDTFRLLVPGGTVEQTTLRVADTPTFAVGDQWLLFLLPEYKTYPVVGMSQGAFRVQTGADGVARVQNAVGQPVAGFDTDGFVQLVPPPPDMIVQPTRAERVRVRSPAAQPTLQPLAYDDFLALLRPILSHSRVYALTGPAGRPAAGQPRAVPLRLAGRSPSAHISRRVDAAQQAVPARQSARPSRQPPAESNGQPPSRRTDP